MFSRGRTSRDSELGLVVSSGMAGRVTFWEEAAGEGLSSHSNIHLIGDNSKKSSRVWLVEYCETSTST